MAARKTHPFSKSFKNGPDFGTGRRFYRFAYRYSVDREIFSVSQISSTSRDLSANRVFANLTLASLGLVFGRPAIGGVSIFHEDEKGAGTLGCLVVKKGTTKPVYVLSNAHVLSQMSTAMDGDAILQPGKLDGGTDADKIATLAESVQFQFRDTPNAKLNTVDAAIAKVTNILLVNNIIHQFGSPTRTKTNYYPDMEVKLVGRTSGFQLGKIDDVDFTTKELEYKKPNGKTEKITFHNQIKCNSFSKAGDSGAAVLNKKNDIVGLHFAGSESCSVFNRIDLVMNTFGVELYCPE